MKQYKVIKHFLLGKWEIPMEVDSLVYLSPCDLEGVPSPVKNYLEEVKPEPKKKAPAKKK